MVADISQRKVSNSKALTCGYFSTYDLRLMSQLY